MLDAVQILSEVWTALPTSLILRCFLRSGILDGDNLLEAKRILGGQKKQRRIQQLPLEIPAKIRDMLNEVCERIEATILEPSEPPQHTFAPPDVAMETDAPSDDQQYLDVILLDPISNPSTTDDEKWHGSPMAKNPASRAKRQLCMNCDSRTSGEGAQAEIEQVENKDASEGAGMSEEEEEGQDEAEDCSEDEEDEDQEDEEEDEDEDEAEEDEQEDGEGEEADDEDAQVEDQRRGILDIDLEEAVSRDWLEGEPRNSLLPKEDKEETPTGEPSNTQVQTQQEKDEAEGQLAFEFTAKLVTRDDRRQLCTRTRIMTRNLIKKMEEMMHIRN